MHVAGGRVIFNTWYCVRGSNCLAIGEMRRADGMSAAQMSGLGEWGVWETKDCMDIFFCGRP